MMHSATKMAVCRLDDLRCYESSVQEYAEEIEFNIPSDDTMNFSLKLFDLNQDGEWVHAKHAWWTDGDMVAVIRRADASCAFTQLS